MASWIRSAAWTQPGRSSGSRRSESLESRNWRARTGSRMPRQTRSWATTAENSRAPLQVGNAIRLVRMDPPALGHGRRCDAYFFFSACMVCLRSWGLYFISLSFSPPGLRRSE